ncbi:hypothetical protein OG401_14465 [Kitasatospora purpeofusca]|uniref:hypothetical protein n=1 Tax=Kitasatospora purpeofusca TaxID=67352 RepID=UPI0022534DA1|nr:hypothetical protein [Kitasatospora purpeofusca]MCX4685503.1 hypothetical protein [Kitasatospora purpeofusca]
MDQTPKTEKSIEAVAAHYEAMQAFIEMWQHGFPRCPLTRYVDAAFRVADSLA